MKVNDAPPRPTLMRDVDKEPLAFSQQLANIAAGTNITDAQKRQLCVMAYKMEHTNKRAAAVRKTVIGTWESFGFHNLQSDG